MLPVPTDEEMKNWKPDPAQPRFRIVHDVSTGKTEQIELTLEEYKARHVAKIVSQNEREARDLEQQRRDERQRVLDRIIDREMGKPG